MIVVRSPRSLRIFLVEDHADTRKFLSIALQRLGHTVVSASTMEEAVKLLRENCYEVLLSDIGLPDGNGWTLLESLRMSRPPVAIAMSGFGSKADIARSLATGFQHHIIKPFRMETLKALLTADADSARQEQTAPEPGR